MFERVLPEHALTRLTRVKGFGGPSGIRIRVATEEAADGRYCENVGGWSDGQSICLSAQGAATSIRPA